MKCIKLQLKRGKTNVQKDINKSGGRTDFSVSGKEMMNLCCIDECLCSDRTNH